MVANILSGVAIVVSIISFLASWEQNRRGLKIQLFEYRMNQYSMLEEIVSTIREHLSILDMTNISFVHDSNYIFELFVNNFAFEKVYACIRTENYESYASQTYQELIRMQQSARSITLVFNDDKYSQTAQALVVAYVEFLKAIYNHHVYTEKMEKSKKDLPELLTITQNYYQHEIDALEKDLEKRQVAELVANLLQRYREFEEIPTLSVLKKQVTLSKP